MPKKGGKKGGKKKGGKKKSKKVPGADAIITRLLTSYERNCTLTESKPSEGIRNALKACAENETVLSKFIVEGVVLEKEGDKPILLEPVMAAIRQERYTHIKDLHIWNYPMSFENTATVASLLEKQCYPLQMIEMMDCVLEPYAVSRFARAFRMCSTLTLINLDYNEFGDGGCKNLCKGLENNTTMLSVSLCFCNLGVASGKYLGEMISTTAVRDLFLDGNNLECEGVIDLIRRCAGQAQYESEQRAEAARRKEEEEAFRAEQEKDGKHRIRSAMSGTGSEAEKDKDEFGEKKKKKKGKKKKKKKETGPPPVGPWIHKLHLADNGIDVLQHGKEFAPILLTRVLKLLLMYSECLEELDLDKNLIGDLSANEIVEALEHRKEIEKLGGVKLKTTYRIQADTLKAIQKLGAGLKKKKKKGKKKK